MGSILKPISNTSKNLPYSSYCWWYRKKFLRYTDLINDAEDKVAINTLAVKKSNF